MEITRHGHYYLHDCYPLQFINTDEVKANIKKNEGQWELFTYYLESKGKLRKESAILSPIYRERYRFRRCTSASWQAPISR